ncbi:MAG: endonuclease III [Candidatus Diapherotrites archaeon]|nr:endonuclease III [Candidatus Diapherotrites archaeon]
MQEDKKTRKAIAIIEILEREGIKLRKQRFTPFQSLVATVLSARTRDVATLNAAKKLFAKYPNAEDLAKAKPKEVERLIHGVGFYRQKAKRIVKLAKIILRNYNGITPQRFEDLIKLPGVGKKTAACVLCNAFNKPAICVDTHVHRIANLLALVNTKTREETMAELAKILPKKYWCRINSCLVALGQRICKPSKQLCNICPISRLCAQQNKI